MQSPPLALARWQDLSLSDQATVRKLGVTAQQIEYAGTVDRAIENCEADKEDDVAGLAIRADGQIVGFLVLKRRSKAPEWASPSAATISAMRVDQAHQGKGIGSLALQVLPRWVAENWPESSSLTLSVDESNQMGIRAYGKAGFQDHGVRVEGRIGWVRYMSKQAACSK